MKQYYFLALMAAVYISIYFTFPQLFNEALEGTYSILLKVLPILILVFIFLFLFELFVKPEKVIKNLGEHAGIKGWFFSIGTGILSSGPMYVWYPLLSDLKKSGMRTSFISTFLYSRAVKLPLLPVMVHYFGITYTAVLAIYMLGTSVIVGSLTELFVNDKDR
ncbi:MULTISPECIES: permease [unclassified Methanosarcina]|uniref:permease n=1 Tax=unclassified Methanosarcina TaxID=2644672 RepID=UPI000615AF7C|nr:MULTISPECIES: permease [unclassified Methanosarcina]AKB18861.1 hypothetical protein MSWHS_1998 [Methanosarcina sp. WWM596]AKB23263.1 hypothetical protein MSWH1_2992 [Methanosarcina sp. WH1]